MSSYNVPGQGWSFMKWLVAIQGRVSSQLPTSSCTDEGIQVWGGYQAYLLWPHSLVLSAKYYVALEATWAIRSMPLQEAGPLPLPSAQKHFPCWLSLELRWWHLHLQTLTILQINILSLLSLLVLKKIYYTFVLRL